MSFPNLADPSDESRRAPVRVAVVAPALAVRAGLRLLLTSQAVEVVAESAGLNSLESARQQADVLLLETSGAAQELDVLEQSLELLGAAGVLFLVGDEVAEDFAPPHILAWGVLPLDSSAEELQAAAIALHAGLIAGAPDLISRLFQTRSGSGKVAAFQGLELVEPLTERETQVLALLAQGLANKQIARSLGISEHTVKFHVSAIYAKLGVTNRTEAVRSGVRRGLVVL
jgi:DNA-binding NarL/FixJ family response regulator